MSPSVLIHVWFLYLMQFLLRFTCFHMFFLCFWQNLYCHAILPIFDGNHTFSYQSWLIFNKTLPLAHFYEVFLVSITFLHCYWQNIRCVSNYYQMHHLHVHSLLVLAISCASTQCHHTQHTLHLFSWIHLNVQHFRAFCEFCNKIQ